MPIDNMPELSGASVPQAEITTPVSIPTYNTTPTIPESKFGTGTSQQSPTAALFGDFAQKLQDASLEQKTAPIYFDWAKSGLDRFQNSTYFGEMGYNPLRDQESNPQNTNEALYGYRQTLGNVFKNAIGGAGALATQTFVEGFKDYGRVLDAVVHWDADRLAPSAEKMVELNQNQTDAFNK